MAVGHTTMCQLLWLMSPSEHSGLLWTTSMANLLIGRKYPSLMDKCLDTRVFFDVLGLEAAARLLELAYAAEKYQVSAIRSGAWYT